ncbi:hypothetical protein FE257_002099 [Aspergillus nanangensis]|uniref:Rhodopsin domain-containing protein n=1 Tax=Aspergillus nanangensis TaxID=2582783 RepID=A0AAD4CV71_ASPNN|nr:hypothetical protein FE257_002099 [Aspergillus nanangensis]
MRNAPPEVVESWPKPNYENPDYQGPQLLIVGVILVTISVIVVALRLWVRLYMKTTAGWDDWLMVVALVLIICSTVTSNLGTTYGWGVHIWDIRPEMATPSLMTSWFNQLQLIIIMTLVKLSLLISYLRFLTKAIHRKLTWGMIGLTTAWGIAYMITMFTACIPLRAYWETLQSDSENCTNKSSATMSFSITNMVTDLMVLVVPIPVLWNLKLPMRERLGLIALMSLGLLACVASGIRIFYTYQTLNVTYDITWDGYQIWLWILIEVNLAVMCASIPTLRPLARRYFPRLGFRNSTYRHGRAAYATHMGSPTSPTGRFSQKTDQQMVHRTDSTEALRQDVYPMNSPTSV